jgi:hypothetical protein
MNHTKLWKIICDESTSFSEIQDYLTSPVSQSDLRSMASDIAQWKLNPVYGISERWVVQVLLVSSHPKDVGVDVEHDIYLRCREWVRMIESVYSDICVSSSGNHATITDDFIRKTMTLKVAFEQWKQKDMRDQLYMLVELYLYYKEVIDEYDAYFRMNSGDTDAYSRMDRMGRMNCIEPDNESNDSKDNDAHEQIVESVDTEFGRVEEEIRVWYNVYKDFANKLLDMIKVYVPKNYQQWIDGIARSQPKAEIKTDKVADAIRISYWKDQELRYIGTTTEHDRKEWRESLLREWMDLAVPTSSCRAIMTADTDTDASLVSYLIDCCEHNDRMTTTPTTSTVTNIYDMIRAEYDNGRYTFFQSLSLLFHRWSHIQTQKKKV